MGIKIQETGDVSMRSPKDKKTKTRKKNSKKGKEQETFPRGLWIGGAHLYEPQEKNLRSND